MHNEKRQKIQEFALDTADKFEYLIKEVADAAGADADEHFESTLEEITDEIQTAYSKLREYIDEKTGKSGKTTGTPLFSFTEGSF